ncbi:MAG: tartrate dehydrogenase [candidate division NC10 bacterium]|nr:tartrate dehydrogenase [candidate division NC10 bacterium]
MKSYRIAVIPGDGVGPEVVAEGLKVMKAAQGLSSDYSLEIHEFPWGSEHYLETGSMMPSDALSTLAAFDAIYLGAVGDPRVPDAVTLHGLLLPIRRGFDQYACVRPLYLYPGVSSPLVGKKAGSIDMVVVRENTEGEYADVGGRIYPSSSQEVAIQAAVFTRQGTERIMRYAFDLARSPGRRKKVTSITKSNAQRFGMVFWDEVFRSVAREYPEVATESQLVDAACMNLVRRPESFDVVVASNLFGDILTDLGAIIIGGMGLAPSANLNPHRTHPSMFEPTHGSAPDIAGKGLANPLASILTAAMMFEFLGEAGSASSIRGAVAEHLGQGGARTPDLGGSARTAQVGDEVVARMSRGKGEV